MSSQRSAGGCEPEPDCLTISSRQAAMLELSSGTRSQTSTTQRSSAGQVSAARRPATTAQGTSAGSDGEVLLGDSQPMTGSKTGSFPSTGTYAGSPASDGAASPRPRSSPATSAAVLTALETPQLPPMGSTPGGILNPSLPSNVFVSPEQLAEFEACTASSDESNAVDGWQCLAAVVEAVTTITTTGSSLQAASHDQYRACRLAAARELLGLQQQAVGLGGTSENPQYTELKEVVDPNQMSWNNDHTGLNGDQMDYDGDSLEYDGDNVEYDGDNVEYDGDNVDYDGDHVHYKGHQHQENIPSSEPRRRTTRGRPRSPVEPSDRDSRRKQRNRLAAKKCREGKELRIKLLKEELDRLDGLVKEKEQHRNALQATVARQRKEIERHRQAGCVFPNLPKH